MHPHDFKSITEHLYEAYYALHEEVLRLQRDNKILSDELNKAKTLNTNLAQKLNVPSVQPPKMLKMGSDWIFDGDPLLFNLSLFLKFKFRSPILKAKISKKGLIAFSCNRFVFLYNGDFHLVDSTLQLVHPSSMRKDLSDFIELHFDFNDEDLIVHRNDSVLCFRNMNLLWSIKLKGVICINCDSGIVYAGTIDSVHCISYLDTPSAPLVTVISVRLPYYGFIVKSKEILFYTDNSLALHGMNFIKSENFQILGVDMKAHRVYYGGSNNTLKIAKINKSTNSMEMVETLIFKKPILNIRLFRSVLLVSIDERIVNVLDTRNKLSMRINLPSNVIDISVNDDMICFVDNNGGLRVWKCIERPIN